jgi:hypothetical protein
VTSSPETLPNFSFNWLPVFDVVIGIKPLGALKEKFTCPSTWVLAVVTWANFLFDLVAKIAVTAKTRVAVLKNIFDFFIKIIKWLKSYAVRLNVTSHRFDFNLTYRFF